MQLRDLMTTTVLCIGPDASLKEAARRMLEAGVSGMPVTDDDGALVGVITEADFVKTEAGRRRSERRSLLRWLTHHHEIPVDEIRVGDVMTAGVITGRTLKRLSYDWQDPHLEDPARGTV